MDVRHFNRYLYSNIWKHQCSDLNPQLVISKHLLELYFLIIMSKDVLVPNCWAQRFLIQSFFRSKLFSIWSYHACWWRCIWQCWVTSAHSDNCKRTQIIFGWFRIRFQWSDDIMQNCWWDLPALYVLRVNIYPPVFHQSMPPRSMFLGSSVSTAISDKNTISPAIRSMTPSVALITLATLSTQTKQNNHMNQ